MIQTNIKYASCDLDTWSWLDNCFIARFKWHWIKSEHDKLFSFQILSESYLLHQKSAEYNNQNNDNLQSAKSVDSVADTTKSSNKSDKTEETDLSSTDLSSVNSSASSISPTGTNDSKGKKESGFLNKCKLIHLKLIN